MNTLEKLDRRAFLRGMMVTGAGLVVPKPVSIVVPNSVPVPVPVQVPGVGKVTADMWEELMTPHWVCMGSFAAFFPFIQQG